MPRRRTYCRVTDLIAANTATGGSVSYLAGGITAGGRRCYLTLVCLLALVAAAEMASMAAAMICATLFALPVLGNHGLWLALTVPRGRVRR